LPQIPQGASSLQLVGFFIGIFYNSHGLLLSLLRFFAGRKAYKIFPKIYLVCKAIKRGDLK
jgi:hypothetical protein